MGKRITLSCEKCGYAMDANVGGGLGSCMPTVIEEALEGEERDKWHKLYKTNELMAYSGNMYIGYCPKCMTLENVFVLRGTKQDGSEVELGGLCSTCGGKCIVYEGEEVSCPHCKTNKLSVHMNGLWD